MKFSTAKNFRRVAAFTMIEIAMSLAVIGFALVAIIGVLPQGMDVQKNNRRETIINQDANYLIQAIRGGARGLDDLTNYVAAITITNLYDNSYVSYLNPSPSFSTFPLPNLANVQPLRLTSGQIIIGLLSTPKYMANRVVTNYVTAYVQAMSGDATEKFPQGNTVVKGSAFSYKLVSEIVPWGATTNYADPASTNFAVLTNVPTGPQVTSWALAMPTNGNISITNFVDTNILALPMFVSRANAWLVARTLQTNLYDVRLLFRWPLLPGGKIGNGRQTYRTLIGGTVTNYPSGSPRYFFMPNNFTTNSL